jgi:hypothetical protein
MSEDKDLEPIIAVAGLGGTGANKGFWEVQLRDRLGQWAEMGRGLLNMVRAAVGLPAKPLRSVYIGASDIPGHFRGLVEGQSDNGYEDGVYHLPSSKSEVFEALLPESVLERQGLKAGPKLDSRGNPVLDTKWTAQDTLDLSQIRIDPITDEDRKLAVTTPTEQERKLIDQKRKESPLAQLPPGAEGQMSPEELKDLVETGPSSVKESPASPEAEAEKKEYPGFTEITSDFDRENNQQVWEKEYEGGQMLLEVAKTEDGTYQATLYSNPDRTGAWNSEEVLDVPNTEDAFDGADRVVNDRIAREAEADRKYEEGTPKAPEAAKPAGPRMPSMEDKKPTRPAGVPESAKFIRGERTYGGTWDANDYWVDTKDGKTKSWRVSPDGKVTEVTGPFLRDEPVKSEKKPTLDMYSQAVVEGITEKNKDKSPAQINNTLKKLHAMLDKSDTNRPATEAVIDSLSNLVKEKGGVPFTPEAPAAKPAKPSSGYVSRGLYGSQDYAEGDFVAVFNDDDPTTPVEVGTVVGPVKDFIGQEKMEIQFPDGKYRVDLEDLQPLDSAIEDMPELADEKAGAPLDNDIFGDLDFGDDEVVEPMVPKKPDGTPSDVPVIAPADIPEVKADQVETKAEKASRSEPKELAQSKISMEELDAFATPESYLVDTNGILPSQEQTRALNAVTETKEDVVIDALAGAGKTWTLIAAANALDRKDPDARVLILAFNAKIAADAGRKAPKRNTRAMTTHSLAYKVLTPTQRKIMSGPNKWYTASNEEEIAKVLQLDDTPLPGVGNVTAEEAAHLLGKIVTKFCNSADLEIGKDHVEAVLSNLDEIDMDKVPDATFDKFVNWSKAYWGDISSDRSPKWNDKTKSADKRRIRITHDHYLKLWSLSSPNLDDILINGKPVTHVFFDEAQDTNPTVSSVMRRNKGRVQQVFVGDPNQAIYGFRGAENFLEQSKPDAGALVDLTRTRRFGDGMTAPGNWFLNLLGARRRVKGVGSGGEVVENEKDIPLGPSTAFISRTNYAGLERIIKGIDDGETVGALSVFYEELEKAVYHLKWIMSDFKGRGRVPQTPDGRNAYSEDFVGISNFNQLLKRADRDPKGKAASWLQLLEQEGGGKEDPTGPFEKILNDLVIDKSDIGESDTELPFETNTEASMWVTKTGKELNYTIDEIGTVKFSGNAVFEKVGGLFMREHLKAAGLRYDKGTTEWYTQISDDEERKEFLNNIASTIPNRVSNDTRVPDVIVTTAHRAKGLEWDNVIIADDFKEPKENPKTKEMEFPSEEEFRTSYVALTRAKKMLYTGSLDWAKKYEGREGLQEANFDLGRGDSEDYGMEAWDYHDAQMAESKDDNLDEKASAGLSNGSYKDEDFDDDEFYEGMDSASGPKKNFIDTWSAQKKTLSKTEGGVTWEIKQNADGSVTLRSRNDDSIATKKYDNMAALEADFKKQTEAGRKSSREELKKAVKSFDKDGSIAKLIDSGASAEDIDKAIRKTDAWEQAIEDNKVNISSLGRALARVGASIPARKRKPKAKQNQNVKEPKATPPAPVITENAIVKRATELNRMDDGADVGRVQLSPEQLEELVRRFKSAKGIDILNAVLTINPESKVLPDGSVVYYRGTKEEVGGPSDGEMRKTEIRVKDTKDGKIAVTIKVEDPEDGSSQEFYHYSRHDSLGSLIGSPIKESAGVERLLSQFFDRDTAKNPFASEQDERYYGGVDGAIKKLRAGRFDRILADKKQDDTSFKLRTPLEDAMFKLNGRSRKLNASIQQWDRQHRKEIPDIFDAIEENDTEMVGRILNSYLTGLPDTVEARKTAMDYLKSQMKSRFRNLDTREMADVIDQAEAKVNGSLRAIGVPENPHLDRNNVAIKPGDKVRWQNNENGEFVVGVVDTLLRSDNPNSGKYSYGDNAFVNFLDSSKEGQMMSVKLNSKHMEVVDPDTPVTKYQGWLKKDDLKLARYEEAGYGFDPATGEFYDKITGNVIDRLGNYADEDGEDGEGLEPEPTTSKSASDLTPGDVVFDEDGNQLGKVKTARRATNRKTGQEVVAVELENGERIAYAADEDVNVSDVASRRTPTPKPIRSAIGEEAAALGLGAAPGSKPQNVLPKFKADSNNKETSVRVRGRKNSFAVRPTPEAKAAKDKAVELGAKVREQESERTIAKLREKGYDIPEGTGFLELADAARDNINTALDDLVSKNDAVAKFNKDGASAMKRSPKKAADIRARMAAEGLADSEGNIDEKALSQALVDADLRPLAYHLESPSIDKQSYGAFAYSVLKGDDSAATEKARSLASDQDASRRAYNDANNRGQVVSDDIAIASGSSVLELLKEQGVEFDNVSYKEFDDRILSDVAGLPLRPEDEFLSAKALQEAFDHLPSSVIRNLAEHLKSENKVLKVKAGVKRGHFKPIPGGYELHLSSSSGRSDQTKVTDTALHELTHFVQKVDPNLRALEHAQLFDLGLENPGTDQELMANVDTIPGYKKSEQGLMIPGLTNPYQAKVYNRKNKNAVLNAEDNASEVFTMAMQDLFTAPGITSVPKNQIIRAVDPKNPGRKKSYKAGKDAFYDEKRGMWFSDSAMTNPIENIISISGRPKESGVDEQFRNFAVGTLLVLNDWSATEGVGPGVGIK